MARSVRTTFGPSGGGFGLADVQPLLQWEFLGFEPTTTGINSYTSSFDRSNFIGYQYIMYGSGSANTTTNFIGRMRDTSGDLTGSNYAWSFFHPSYYQSMGSWNSQNSFYTSNNYFTNNTSGHPTIRASVFFRSASQTDFEMQFGPSGGSGYQQSLLYGNYYNTTGTPTGIRLHASDNSTLCINGGVYRFGMRRRS